MKNAANCVNQCELQDTLIIDVSNAHGGSGSLPEPRPVEGRFLPLRDFATAHPVASRTVPRGSAPRGRLRVRSTRSARVLSLPALRGARRALGGRSRHRPPFGALLALGPRRGARLPFRGLPSFFRPQLGRDDPLNLSILLRGGQENNDDSLSKGDGSGNSPAPKPDARPTRPCHVAFGAADLGGRRTFGVPLPGLSVAGVRPMRGSVSRPPCPYRGAV
jgi:hypothetical protein